MKKTVTGMVIAGGLILSASAAMAGGVGFANVQDIFETSSLGKAKVTADEKALKPQMETLKKDITDLQEKVNSYTEEKDAALSDIAKGDTKAAAADNKTKAADKIAAQDALEKAMKQYQDLMYKVQNLASTDAEAFKDALSKASADVAKDKKLDAILPAEMSLYNVDSIDVTKEIVAKMK
jgi:Skp family chaperone for outer membrane proteins